MLKNSARINRHFAISAGIGVVALFAWHVQVDSRNERAFKETTVGESLNSVLARFGEPSNIAGRRQQGELVKLPPCENKCQLRLWYSAPILGGVSPYSIDFDAQQKVIFKFHWQSP